MLYYTVVTLAIFAWVFGIYLVKEWFCRFRRVSTSDYDNRKDFDILRDDMWAISIFWPLSLPCIALKRVILAIHSGLRCIAESAATKVWDVIYPASKGRR